MDMDNNNDDFQVVYSAMISDNRPFVKMYVDTVAKLMDISHHDLGVLAELAKRMDIHNVVVVDTTCKESIADTLGVSAGSVGNRITNLIKNPYKPLIRQSIGHYVVNPALYSKRGKDYLNVGVIKDFAIHITQNAVNVHTIKVYISKIRHDTINKENNYGIKNDNVVVNDGVNDNNDYTERKFSKTVGNKNNNNNN